MDALVQGGATLVSNTQMVNLLSVVPSERCDAAGLCGWELLRLVPWNGAGADFRPTGNSPVRDAGANLGAEYQYDLLGIKQNRIGRDGR